VLRSQRNRSPHFAGFDKDQVIVLRHSEDLKFTEVGRRIGRTVHLAIRGQPGLAPGAIVLAAVDTPARHMRPLEALSQKAFAKRGNGGYLRFYSVLALPDGLRDLHLVAADRRLEVRTDGRS
jgi:hypothetical protein